MQKPLSTAGLSKKGVFHHQKGAFLVENWGKMTYNRIHTRKNLVVMRFSFAAIPREGSRVSHSIIHILEENRWNLQVFSKKGLQ